MSVVYPVARGVAPTLVLLAGVVVLGLQHVVGAGCRRRPRRARRARDPRRPARRRCRRRRLRARDRGRDRLVHARRQARARLRDPDRLPRGLDDRAGHPLRGLGGSDARRRRGAAERAQPRPRSSPGSRRSRPTRSCSPRSSARPQPQWPPCARRASSSPRSSRRSVLKEHVTPVAPDGSRSSSPAASRSLAVGG